MVWRKRNPHQELIDACCDSAKESVEKTGLTQETRKRVEFALNLGTMRRRSQRFPPQYLTPGGAWRSIVRILRGVWILLMLVGFLNTR